MCSLSCRILKICKTRNLEKQWWRWVENRDRELLNVTLKNKNLMLRTIIILFTSLCLQSWFLVPSPACSFRNILNTISLSFLFTYTYKSHWPSNLFSHFNLNISIKHLYLHFSPSLTSFWVQNKTPLFPSVFSLLHSKH